MKIRIPTQEHDPTKRAATVRHNEKSRAAGQVGMSGHAAQRKLQESINNSPYMAAQRKRLEGFSGIVQKASPEEEELAQGKFEVQRQAEEEEELAQGKFVNEPLLAAEDVQRKAIQRNENKTGMPDDVKSRMETIHNADFSDVRIHANSSQAPAVGALAYTQGSNIHFAPGQFSPDTSAGKSLLGHELTHVVQQREGRVQPTIEVGGMPVNDDVSLEKEADSFGSKV